MTATTTGIDRRIALRMADRLCRIEEDVQRLRDEIHYELGEDRVRVEHVKAGDVIGNYGWQLVTMNEHWHDGDRRLHFSDSTAKVFDPASMVSRKRPDETLEPF
jgi:hypothetical protein